MDFERLKIKEYNHWTVYLNEHQYYLGCLYIWAKREDALDFMSMTPDEREELFKIGSAVNKALSELFHPNLMNYAALGNMVHHLHLHIIPRYSSPRIFDGLEFVDERWGKNYAPFNHDFKIPEAKLFKIRDAISGKI